MHVSVITKNNLRYTLENTEYARFSRFSFLSRVLCSAIFSLPINVHSSMGYTAVVLPGARLLRSHHGHFEPSLYFGEQSPVARLAPAYPSPRSTHHLNWETFLAQFYSNFIGFAPHVNAGETGPIRGPLNHPPNTPRGRRDSSATLQSPFAPEMPCQIASPTGSLLLRPTGSLLRFFVTFGEPWLALCRRDDRR